MDIGDMDTHLSIGYELKEDAIGPYFECSMQPYIDKAVAATEEIIGETLKNYATPGETIADYELATGNVHGTNGILSQFESGAKVMKLDGYIAQYLHNCRPAALGSHSQKKYLEEKTGLPVLSLEIDAFDSRAYNADSLRTKVETFAEMLKAKKGRP